MPKKGKGKKSSKKASGGVGDTLKSTALGVVDEVEKAGGVVLGEIRNSFDFIGGKVADTARVAADTTVAVKDKVTSKEVTDQLQGLLKDVEEVGEGLVNVITSHFESLRKSIAKPPKKTKKKSAGKKAGSKKKPAAGKKPVKKKGGKKAAAKKKAVKKTRKKAAAKKKAGTRKKSTVRKTGTRKKTVSRKRVAKKAARKRS